MRAPAAAAALVVLGAAAGTVTYVAVRDEPEPLPTTTTTTVAPAPTPTEIADAVIDSLERGLEVPLSREEAGCVGTALLALVGDAEAARWVDTPASALTAAQHDALVRAVVTCVPEAKAQALLGATTTTSAPQDLPDE